MRARFLLLLAAVTIGLTSVVLTVRAQVPMVSVTMSGPATVEAGGVIRYTMRITNLTSSPLTNVFLGSQDPSNGASSYGLSSELVAEGLGSGCQMAGSRIIRCGPYSLAANQALELSYQFRVPANAPCNKRYVIASGVTSAEAPNTASQTISTTVSCTGNTQQSGQLGCISILAEAFNAQNNKMKAPIFTFRLENNQTVQTNENGIATIQGVPVGQHTVTEVVPSGWELMSVTPQNGIIQVVADDACAGMAFKNRQTTNETIKRLGLEVRDTPDPLRAGEELTYEISIHNYENVDRRVDVRATLDRKTVFINAELNGREVSAGEVIWRDVQINRSDTMVLRLRVRTDASLRDGEMLSLRVKADDQTDTESTRIVGNTPSGTGLSLQKQANRSEANPGDTVTYTLTVRNGDNVPVNNLAIIDTFNPSQVSVLDLGGGVVIGNTITWEIGSLAANQTRVISYRMQLSSALRSGDTVRNTAVLPGGQIAVNDIHIVTQLPKTGIMDFTRPFENSKKYLRSMHGESASGGSSAAAATVWGTMFVSLLGLGVGATKRYFI